MPLSENEIIDSPNKYIFELTIHTYHNILWRNFYTMSIFKLFSLSLNHYHIIELSIRIVYYVVALTIIRLHHTYVHWLTDRTKSCLK